MLTYLVVVSSMGQATKTWDTSVPIMQLNSLAIADNLTECLEILTYKVVARMSARMDANKLMTLTCPEFGQANHSPLSKCGDMPCYWSRLSRMQLGGEPKTLEE